jgi:membrane-associated protease RseP (regulator of RpoE activity)
MDFIVIDVTFLVLCTVFLALSFIIKRKKWYKEGPMFLYRTSVGLKIIDYLGKKYPKTLKLLSYIIVVVGYILMIIGIYLLIQLIAPFTNTAFVKVIKIPPLMPLLPYVDRLFNVSWLPNFYFIDFLIAIIIVAIAHEGFHGIFARFNNIKIKSTGFGFMGPILIYPILSLFDRLYKKSLTKKIIFFVLLAIIILLEYFLFLANKIIALLLIFPLLAFFVEQDDKQMRKAKIFPQLTMLGAGLFANILLYIIFFFLMIGFFNIAYAPSGAIFNDYSYSPVSFAFTSSIIPLNETLSVDNSTLTKVAFENKTYWVAENLFKLNISQIEELKKENNSFIRMYQDQPAIINKLSGAIVQIDNTAIKNNSDITIALNGKKPGEEVVVVTENPDNSSAEQQTYRFALGADYSNSSRPVMGIAILKQDSLGGFKGFMSKMIIVSKDPNIYYKAKGNADFTQFIYDLLWWIVLINFSVAIFNMLPVTIFDGGRFFYLTILAITKKEKIAKNAFKIATFAVLFLFVFLMFLYFRAYMIK